MKIKKSVLLVLALVFLYPFVSGSGKTFVNAQTPEFDVYLPLVLNGSSGFNDNLPLNAQEQALFELIRDHPDQGRSFLNINSILTQVARERALDMGTRGYFGHVNPDGYGPNYLVQQAGYVLPSFYSQHPTGNNIESIAAGSSTANQVWNNWMNSTGHRTHLLGLSSFFAEQTDIGIGYAYVPGSPYGHYWVVITARH